MCYSKTLYSLSNKQIQKVCAAPNCDTFGYACFKSNFLCFDWLEKCFFKLNLTNLKFEKCLEELQLNKAHIMTYLNYFFVLDWEQPRIFVINEDFRIKVVEFYVDDF